MQGTDIWEFKHRFQTPEQKAETIDMETTRDHSLPTTSSPVLTLVHKLDISSMNADTHDTRSARRSRASERIRENQPQSIMPEIEEEKLRRRRKQALPRMQLSPGSQDFATFFPSLAF
jgi:hypothetical protein